MEFVCLQIEQLNLDIEQVTSAIFPILSWSVT